MIDRGYFNKPTRTEDTEEEPKVFLYALSDCEHCKAAKAFLNTHRIPYAYVYVDQLPPEIRIAFKKEITQKYYRNLLYPLLELPEGEFLFGFEEPIWREKLSLNPS
ncbi:MAG: glutaredoxin domain-containing protein [Spirochaetales bacterium]